MIGRIIGGLIGAGIGFIMVWKSSWFAENFGSISEFGERYLGGPRNFYKILGILFIFISFLIVTNLHVAFFRSTVGGALGVPEEEPIYVE